MCTFALYNVSVMKGFMFKCNRSFSQKIQAWPDKYLQIKIMALHTNKLSAPVLKTLKIVFIVLQLGSQQ